MSASEKETLTLRQRIIEKARASINYYPMGVYGEELILAAAREVLMLLVKYRPQHDEDCDSLRCADCGFDTSHRCMCYAPRNVNHPCSCGLDELLTLLGEEGGQQGQDKNDDQSRSGQPQPAVEALTHASIDVPGVTRKADGLG